MPPDSLLRRVRWGNLASLLALPAVVLLVVLWPRLSPAPPGLPAARPQPVAAPASDGPSISRARAGKAPAAEGAGGGERPPRAKQATSSGADDPAARPRRKSGGAG